MGRTVSRLLTLRRVALLGLVVGVLGIASQRQSHAYMPLEVGCLALNIYHEARDESHDGQVAVAAVTLNRMQSASYPDTICGVVWQPHQFSWTRQQVRHKHRDPRAWLGTGGSGAGICCTQGIAIEGYNSFSRLSGHTRSESSIAPGPENWQPPFYDS